MFGYGKTKKLKLELHAIIFRKPYDLNKAKQEAKKIYKNKRYSFRETKQSYRFSILKTKFIPSSFVTKIINPEMSMVFGNLKLYGGDLLGDLGQKLISKVNELGKSKKAPPHLTNPFTGELKSVGEIAKENPFVALAESVKAGIESIKEDGLVVKTVKQKKAEKKAREEEELRKKKQAIFDQKERNFMQEYLKNRPKKRPAPN
jgi:putative sterol carrier protein